MSHVFLRNTGEFIVDADFFFDPAMGIRKD